MPKYRPYITDDGSIGLFSGDYDDIFHSRYGALTEAYEKFILPINLEKYFNQPELNVLDICYGIGYNTKAFLNFLIKTILNKCHIASIYSDKIEEGYRSICTETIPTDKTSKGGTECLEEDEIFLENKNQRKCVFYNEKISRCRENFYNKTDQLKKGIEFIPMININALEFEQEFVDISPLIKEICHNEEYKILPVVNDFIYQQLINQYGDSYFSRIKTYASDIYGESGALNTYFKFFDENRVKNVIKGQRKGYKHTLYSASNLLLHNIYYRHISKRPIIKQGVFTNEYYQNISKLLFDKIDIQFFTEDARISIQKINKQFDLIFLDAFTPSKLPTLWTVEFFKELFNKISDNGVLLTYTNSARVRSAMSEAGFLIGNIKSSDDHLLGTIATKNINNIKCQLSSKELGLLNTKAGIPYHDECLSLSKDEILALLEKEINSSNKISSSQYLKGVANEI